MDPSTAQITPRVSLGESGVSTPRTGTPGVDTPKATEKREVFSDLRKLVTFAVRKDREQKGQD